MVAFDAADLDAESAFWAGVLGGEVDRDDGWHMVTVDGEPKLGVQFAPDPAGHPCCLCFLVGEAGYPTST